MGLCWEDFIRRTLWDFVGRTLLGGLFWGFAGRTLLGGLYGRLLGGLY